LGWGGCTMRVDGASPDESTCQIWRIQVQQFIRENEVGSKNAQCPWWGKFDAEILRLDIVRHKAKSSSSSYNAQRIEIVGMRNCVPLAYGCV